MLIEAVDEGGYLRADLFELAERLGCDEARVEAVLTVLQGFEPTGVFARDVAECLTLQLKEKQPLRPRHGGAGRPTSSCWRAAICRACAASARSMTKT